MHAQFEQFVRDKKYLLNVSDRTCDWYRQSLKWLDKPTPTEADLRALVIKMREAGLKPTSVNCRLRAIRSYLTWSGSSVKIPRLKEPVRVLPTFQQSDITKFAKWKPRRKSQMRLQVLLLTLADCGCRIDEALTLRWTDVDMDNLLLTVHGKGDKERKIPFSFELRRFLHRHQQRSQFDLVFCSRDGMKLHRRSVLRDTKVACKTLAVKIPERTLHAFRHSFALQYLRKGGSVFHLQRCLGHSSLEMTRRYANLATADLSAIHQKVSMLSGL